MKRTFAAVLALFAATAAAQDATLLRGGRVVPVSGPALARADVLIAGGKIAAIGPNLAAPAGATVIDVSGQHVYPGLIDGLTTLGLTEIGSVPGSVDVREAGDVNPHARAWLALHPHSELIPVARAAGITHALSAPAGGLVSGQSALVRLAGGTPAALVVRGPAALHVAWPSGSAGFDIAQMFAEPELKTFDERQKEKKKNQDKALARLAELLARARTYAAAHAASVAGQGPAPELDLALEALAPAARGEMPVVFRADAEDDIRGALAFASQHDLKPIIAGGLEAWRCADALKAADAAVLAPVDRLPRRESDAYDAAYTNVLALHRAGVRFAIVTDDASNSRNLPHHAAMARAFGLPAEVALRAITLAPAEIFGVAGALGSLEVGKSASLFVASGDPMDHRSAVIHVFVDGVPQSLETRHTHLYQQFKDR
ncbi:MAG: amidohydrolase family protein [Vicinamibacteria bacterium]|nr:amidohydrolase family protein [Vicinamibacteria bacterium]